MGGGGIGNFNGGRGAGNDPGILTVNPSKMHDNTTGGVGGGILNENFTNGAPVATVTLTSTFVNNNSPANGGGIFDGAGFAPTSPAPAIWRPAPCSATTTTTAGRGACPAAPTRDVRPARQPVGARSDPVRRQHECRGSSSVVRENQLG